MISTKLFPIDVNCPPAMVKAVKLIFICIGMSMAASIIDSVVYEGSGGSVVFQILISALYFLFPYFLLRGSDVARFLFVVVEGVSVALFVTSDLNMPPVTIDATYLQIPLMGFIFSHLFNTKCNEWVKNLKVNK